ncbi:MAG TPA: lipopolysaccharide heptosyltransferase II [Terriglobia bacterium]|nr:lipopolysaccharide heptosyltransferase II [Terriglobia bacterium]
MIVRSSGLANPQKIVVRVPNWIGDAVMSLPALEALRAQYPSAEITVVAKPWVSDLYDHHPAVDRQIVYDAAGEHRGSSGFRKLVGTIRDEDFDAAILFQNALQAAWMAWRARIPQRIGYARDGRSLLLTEAVEAPTASAYGHQAYYYLQLLFRAGLIDKPATIREVRLRIEPSEKAWASKHLESLGLRGPRFLVGLNPGASFGPAKRWLPEYFADLADRLIGALNADVVVFGSAKERPLAEEIAHAMEHTPTIVAGDTALREFMALLSHCRLIVSNDSGPMHLAAALGLPVVAIFGSTDERATGPISPRARTVKKRVPCSPCGLRECPIDFRCMRGLTVESVFRTCLELVKETGVTHERAADEDEL